VLLKATGELQVEGHYDVTFKNKVSNFSFNESVQKLIKIGSGCKFYGMQKDWLLWLRISMPDAALPPPILIMIKILRNIRILLKKHKTAE
jgi:hypothetical protein